MIAKCGGRKCLVVLLALTMSFILALLDKLVPAFAQVVSISVFAFLGAHAVDDYKNGRVTP